MLKAHTNFKKSRDTQMKIVLLKWGDVAYNTVILKALNFFCTYRYDENRDPAEIHDVLFSDKISLSVLLETL